MISLWHFPSSPPQELPHRDPIQSAVDEFFCPKLLLCSQLGWDMRRTFIFRFGLIPLPWQVDYLDLQVRWSKGVLSEVFLPRTPTIRHSQHAAVEVRGAVLCSLPSGSLPAQVWSFHRAFPSARNTLPCFRHTDVRHRSPTARSNCADQNKKILFLVHVVWSDNGLCNTTEIDPILFLQVGERDVIVARKLCWYSQRNEIKEGWLNTEYLQSSCLWTTLRLCPRSSGKICFYHYLCFYEGWLIQ